MTLVDSLNSYGQTDIPAETGGKIMPSRESIEHILGWSLGHATDTELQTVYDEYVRLAAVANELEFSIL